MKHLIALLIACASLCLQTATARAQETKGPGAPAAPKPAAAAAAAAPNTQERNIRFQFDGIPYPDVLERFAQMANKPLVADTNIQGTLTYNDPSPYTYGEAFDTMNLILSMKGLMLVEDGHYLRLVPFKELPQMPLRILHGLDKTADVRPGEVVTVVLDVKNLDSKEVGEAVVSMLSSAGSVAPLSRGRGLILTDRLANIQRVRTLLAAIDTEAVAERQMKAFTLLHASGAVVADLLNRTFGLATAPKRTQFNPTTKALDVLPPDPDDYVTAVYDDASRTLVLFGPRNRLGLAEELISKFEDKDGGGSDVRIYYPQVTKAEELAQMIRQAVPGVAAPGESAAAAATKARVIADPAQNRLIVASPVAGQLDQIELLVNKLDKPVHGTGGVFPATRSQTVQVTKVFRPRSADVSSAAKILTEALTRRMPTGVTLPIANVSVEPNSQSVVVTGSPGDVQTAIDIMAQLETGSTSPMPQATRFLDVGTVAEAKRLAPLVEQIYRSQVPDSLGGQVAHAKIMPDTESGRLIVTASSDHLKRIEDIVKQVKADKTKPSTRHLQIIALKNLHADTGLASLNNLVAERMADKRFEDQAKPLLLPDAANNRLLVTATDEQLREIQEVVKTLDIAPEKIQREMRVVPIQSKSASELITLTTQLMTQLGEEQTNPQLAPRLIPDPSGKQIIVLAPAKDLERITNLVQQLDSSSTVMTSRQFRGIDLFSRTAAEMTPLVQQLYQEQLKGQIEPAGGPATLIAETKNNRIMVSGSEKEIARAEAIIRQLDPAGRKGAKDETRVIRLKAALAADLASLVEKSLGPQSPMVKVMVDPRSNSLVLSGDSGSVEAASQIIQQLDTKSDVQPRELRIIELKQGEASALAPMVTSLVTDMVKDQRGPEYTPQTKVVPDAAANRLIVTGPKDELKTLSSVVEQLDQAPEGAGGARVFKLGMADAATMAPVVSNAMVRFDARNQPIRRVTISADRESNSLIVAGSRSDLQDAQSIIERLDREGIEKGRELKILEVKTTDPDALAALAMKVFTAQNTGRNVQAAVSITPDASGKRLIVLAPGSALAQVEAVISTLDTKPDQGARELQTVELKNGSAAELLPTVNRIYSEQTQGKTTRPASIYADGSGTRLLVYGTAEQGEAVRQIIGAVETEKRAPRETRTFEVGNATEVQRLLPLVQQLYQDQWKDRVGSDPADAQIMADARAGRLIVTGKPEHVKKIEVILNQLNTAKPKSDARDTRVFDLTTANAVELAATVRSLYQEQAKSRLGPTPPDTLLLPEATANRLIVVGETNELDIVEEIVRKLDKVGAQSASVRVFKLKSAEPEKVLEILTTAMVRYDAYGKPQKRISVSIDAKSRTLIVTGDPKELQGVSVIIEQLDASLGTQSPRMMKVLALKQGGVGELSPKLRQLYNDQVKAQPELGTADALILEDAASDQLILAGSDAQLKLIDQIVAQLQEHSTAQEARETRVYDLNTTTAAELSATVKTLYQEQLKGRPAAASSQAVILPDVAANRLVISGATNELLVIDEIVKKLDKVDGQSGRTRVFKLKTAEAEQVATVLSTALTQVGPYGRVIPRVSVGADRQNNLLIVSGEPKDLQSAGVIVEQMDTMLAREPRQMRILPLKKGVAAEVATKVKNLYQDQMKGQPKGGSADALVMGDETSNRLIITASESHLKIIEEIVQQLQQTDESAARQLRVMMLQRNSAASLATMISQLFARQTASQDPAERLVVTPWTDDRTLVLEAGATTLEKVDQLVKMLDGEQSLGKVEVRTYQLSEGNAGELAPTLGRLFAEKSGQPPGALAPRFEGDAGASVLMVAATKEQFVQIDKLMEDLKKTTQVANEIATFKLQNGDPTQIAEVLEAMLTDNDPRQPGQAPRPQRVQFRPGVGMQPVPEAKTVRVMPAPALNSVVVQGPPEKLALAEKLVQTLDKEHGDGKSVIQTVHLKKAHAENLAEAVSKTMTSRGPKSRTQRVTVTPVLGPNSLLLNGPSEGVEEVLKIIRDLDQETEDDEIKVHIYKLENGNAKEVSAVIERLLESVTRQLAGTRAASARPVQATVAVEDRSNSLIISATPTHFKVVEQLLQTLDKLPAKSERDVNFVWLRNAKAADVVSKIEAVFAGRTEGEKPVVEADAFNNSITIIGKRGEVAQVQDLIARLDESTRDTSLQVRLRPLDRVPAEQMARMLQNIYPQMSAGQIRMVEKIQPVKLEKSSTPPASPAPGNPATPAPPSGGAGEKKEDKPAGTADAGTTPAATAGVAGKKEDKAALPEVTIGIDKSANALILSGPTHELDEIDRIISELSYSYISSDAEFRVFPMKEADPVIVARTLTDLFRPEQIQIQQPQQPLVPGQIRTITPAPKITVVAEPRTRSVIVRAKATDFTLMETLIKQLDVAGLSSQLEFRMVLLTNAPPEKVAPLVQQMVTQLSLIRPGEPLTVTADPRSHGLLVVARDTVLTQVEKMIRTLDTPSSYAEAEVRVMALKKASATQLAAVLQNMIKPGAAGEVTAEARELQEQVRRLKVQGDDGKTALLDLTKPIKIMADPLGGGNRLVLASTTENLKAMAAVVEMMDSVPLIEGVNVRLVRLEFADATAVSQTLTTIFTQGQRLATGPGGRSEPEGASGKALVNPLNVAVDPRSNALILSGQKESLDLAEKVISDLDRKLERFTTEVKLFRLKHASAIRLAPLLQSVFAEGPAVPGTEGLATQVTRLQAALENEKPKTADVPKTRPALLVQADDTSNILIVAARVDTLPLIEAVINQLDIPSASGLDAVRIYPLSHTDAMTMQKIIADLYSGPRVAQMRLEDKPNVTIDERTQALIVSGNQKAFAIVDSLIAQLDKQLPLELRDVRILALEHADASDVAAALQRLLDARVNQRGTLSKQQADSMRALIIGEPRSNSLLITGSKDNYELAETLAKQLDRAPAALSGKIRLVPLAFADARFLASSLNTLFSQRYQAAKSPETQRNKPVIVPDPRSNSLLVAAGVDDNQVLDDLVLKLDKKLEDPAMTLTVIGLTHNDASRVATTFEGIFAARLKARTLPGQEPSPQDMVKLETDSLNNALIVSASKENLELMKGLLGKIDIEPVAAGGVVQTFTLQFADAQRVATMLRALVEQGLYRPGMPVNAVKGPGAPREAMAVTVDPRSNTLIVSASPENLLVIKEVIKQVDTKDFSELGNIRLYPLKHAKASSMATVLDQFFRAKRTGDAAAVNAPERMPPVAVVPDDRVNTLLVTGSKESFDVIERVIQQLDGEDTMARMNFKVFPLKQATAIKLQDTLQRLFANRTPRIKGEPVEPITVVADAWVNALIVGAAVDDMGMATTLIERLDSEQAQLGLTVQVFSLAKADARKVAQTVQGLYREGTAGMTLPVVVSADERLNAVVVSAGEGDLKRIGDLMKKLDTDQVARVSEIRIFSLRFARAESMSTILNTALNTKPAQLTDQSPNSASLLQFITRTEGGRELVASALREGVLITPDARMNSLIVSAPVDYMGLLEQIVTRLDASSPQQAKIKVFTLVNADARQMAELLMSMFRLQPQAGQQNASPRSIQYTLVKRSAASSEDPGNPDDPGDPRDESDGPSVVVGTDEQNALHVTVDPRTNCLLVGGTEHYVTLVSEVIDNLDSSSAQERKSEVYRLRNAQAGEVQVAIRSFLDQERQRVTQVLGQDAVGTAQRTLEHEVAIVAEPVSNTLLLAANPRYFAQLKQLIEKLDQPQPQVLIQVLLAEVTLDSTHELGVEWNVTKTFQNVQLATGTDFGVANALKSFGGFSTAVTGSDYNFLLRALDNDGRLEVLSRPQILTADNKPASINIGQRVPLVTDSRTTQYGDTISSFQYQNVGVNLSVTPRIGADGAVKMEIGTTNSALSSSSIAVGFSKDGTPLNAPIINERRAMTSVSVQSGQSIIIGGLISTSDDHRVNKVPFLGDIPLLGVLFRSTTKITDRKELLILLTPQVMVNVDESAILSDPRTMTDEQLKRSPLKDDIKRDKLQDQLLEPFYPERKHDGPESKPKPSSSPAEGPKKEKGSEI